MKIYEKIIRRLPNNNLEIKDIFKKDTLKRIQKDMETLNTENINFGVEELTIDNLTDFYENIYMPIIGNKSNSKTKNLLEKITQEEIDKKNRFLGYIRKDNILLGGWIFKYFNGQLTLWYKCNQKDNLNLRAGFGTLIDYLFLSLGLEKWVERFSYGKDRNGYGGIWSAPWVCFHKLHLGFKPYNSKNNSTIEIDEKKIKTGTIIFSDVNEDISFKTAIIINPNNETAIDGHILKKNWFNVKIYIP